MPICIVFRAYVVVGDGAAARVRVELTGAASVRYWCGVLRLGGWITFGMSTCRPISGYTIGFSAPRKFLTTMLIHMPIRMPACFFAISTWVVTVVVHARARAVAIV